MPTVEPSIRDTVMELIASPLVRGGIFVVALLLAWRVIQWLYTEYPRDTPPGAS